MIDTAITLRTLLDYKLIDRSKYESLIERTLANINITTVEDLLATKDISIYYGIGQLKVNKFLELQEAVRQIQDSDLEQAKRLKEECVQVAGQQNVVDLTGIPECILAIPLSWLCDSGWVEDSYTNVIENVLSGKTIKDLAVLDIDYVGRKRGVGVTKLEQICALQQRIVSIFGDGAEMNNLRLEYLDSETVPVLPSSCSADESYASLIRRFIDEVVQVYRKRGKEGPCTAIELVYKYGYDLNLVAINQQRDRETIRVWLTSTEPRHKSFIWELRNLVASDSSAQSYYISAELRNALKEIQQLCATTPLKSSLMQLLGSDADDKTLNFILDYLDAKIFGGDVGFNTRIKEEFIVVGCNKDYLNKEWGVVFKMLDGAVKPQLKESVIQQLRKHSRKLPKEVEGILTSIIENSNQFEVEKNGLITTYSLKWSELSSMQSRIERILYEAKASMHKVDIEAEYNKHLRYYNLPDPEVFHIKSSKNIFLLYEGGTWIWKEYTTETKTISRENLIRKYAAKHQKFRLDDIMTYLRGIISSINERTVKTILTKNCVCTVEGFYLDKNSSDDHSALHKVTLNDILPELTKIMEKNREYTYRELSSAYCEKYKISVPDSKIKRACENSDVFIIIKGSGNRIPHKVKLNPAWDGTYQQKDKKRGIQAEWKQNVREEIINKLRYAPGYEMDRRTLCKDLKCFIPKDINTTGLYKVFNDKMFIVRCKDNGRSTVVALNKQEWKSEYKQKSTSNTDGYSTYKYDTNYSDLQRTQQHYSKNSLYCMSTRSREDLDDLCKSVQSSLLYGNLKKLERENMAITDVEATWAYMVEKMNIFNGGRDNAYYRMLNQLYGYLFGSTNRTDRYYMWVEMRLNFEPYLKTLLTSKGFDITDENHKELQLQKLINLCQEYKILPKQEQECYITSCISNILTKRNYRGHNAENTPADAFVISNVQMVATLYLYTSMRFAEYTPQTNKN